MIAKTISLDPCGAQTIGTNGGSHH